jgi:hypothetical protein
LRRIGIVSVKVWLLRRWRLAQGFLNPLTVEGETMNTFAWLSFHELLIFMLVCLGLALGLGAVFALAITMVFRSRESR